MQNSNEIVTDHISSLLFIMIAIYALLLMVVGPDKAGRAVKSLVIGSALAGIKFIARLLKIVIMCVVNLSAFSLRIFGRPDQIQEAWAKLVERTADVILDA